MKNLLIILVSLLLAGCAGRQSPEAVLSGRISNPAIESITLSGDGFLQKVPLDNGAFSIAVDLAEPGYYKLWHDRNQALLFLAPGTAVDLTADADTFEASLTFTGQGEAENNLLARERVFQDERTRQMNRGSRLFSRGETSFAKAIASIYDPLLTDLDAAAPQLDPEFVALERLRLGYEQANQLLSYPELHAKTIKDSAFTPSPAYYQFLNELDLNDPRALKTESFREFLPKLVAARTAGAGPDPGERLRAGFDFIQKSITEAPIRDFAFFAVTRDAIRRDGAHILPPMIEEFKKHCQDDNLLAEIDQEYEKWRPLVPGRPVGEYTFVDLKGSPQSLSSLQGKYVLLEVWASWCAVCRGEYPYLEDLQKKIAGKENLAFVGISIDENDAPWRQLIRARQMQGLHLLAEDGWGSAICQDFQINSLPRFILLDPQGKIVDYDAPRPSTGRLEEILVGLTDAK